MRIALTHGEGRLEALAPLLEARGHQVLRAPLIATEPCLDRATREAARALLTLPWLLVTSRSTVEAWVALGMPWQRGGAEPGPQLAAIGPRTARALERAGARVTLVADEPSAAGLARAFLETGVGIAPGPAGPVGLPQGSRARPELRAALETAGVETRPLVVYRTVPRPWPEDDGGVEAVVLASPSALDRLPARVVERARLVALGPTTRAAAEARGLRCLEADAPTPHAVADTLDAVAADAVPNPSDRPDSPRKG